MMRSRHCRLRTHCLIVEWVFGWYGCRFCRSHGNRAGGGEICCDSFVGRKCGVSLIGVLEQLGGAESVVEGKVIHAHIIKAALHFHVSLLNRLANMYAKCGCLEDARQVLDKMPHRNVVSWNIMITGYAKCGHTQLESLKLFSQMQVDGKRPDRITFAGVLSACIGLNSTESVGQQVHSHIIKIGFESNVFVGSSLLDMYAKCGYLQESRQVFDKMTIRDVVVWNAIIAGCVQHGYVEEALKLFSLLEWAGLMPDEFTFGSILSGCGSVMSLEEGKQIHVHIIKIGLELSMLVGSALVDMVCSKWTKRGGCQALLPNANGSREARSVGNSLVTTYAKSGCIEDAHQMFNDMSQLDLVSWTAMIGGYAYHGFGKEALQIFEQMLETGMKPDDITFIGVLSACSHSGLVHEGYQYFDSMTQNHGITPIEDHYACMIDLLGRAGCLNEADNLMRRMPFEPNASLWGTLLAACRIHNNMELGIQAAECLFKLEPQNAVNYVLMSNIYASAGRWDYVAKVRKMMKDRGVRKNPGCSWIEVKNRVYSFVVGDRSHPQVEDIYAMLEILAKQMKEAGYVPDANFVLRDVVDEYKDNFLIYHSEKLALSFGIISTPHGIPIIIIKNLRVCGDCHTAIKFISKIVGREIIVRDVHRFHHFKDGLCSCLDYW